MNDTSYLYKIQENGLTCLNRNRKISEAKNKIQLNGLTIAQNAGRLQSKTKYAVTA